MKPRMTVLTVGVDDLNTSLRFYRAVLAWKRKESSGKNSSMVR
jgi:catechol 2,3-dioxygenase-like lactoylglutathione lyase family enzyme